MKPVLTRSQFLIKGTLLVSAVAWFYIGLFLTISLWYPSGISHDQWQSHLIHFTVVYMFWAAVLFSYRLFEVETMRVTQSFISRLIIAMSICFTLAVLYFYFQPELLLTPRRFLIVHVLITGLGIMLWYILMRRAVQRSSGHVVYAHSSLNNHEELQTLLQRYKFLGLEYAGVSADYESNTFSKGTILILPNRHDIADAGARELFELRNLGVHFVEYPELYETLTRAIHLSALTDMWFLHSVDYSKHVFFDSLKKIFDIFSGLVVGLIFVATYPFIALLIKASSSGPILFRQLRTGQLGQDFTLYKYRTMTIDSSSDTWAHSGQTVTWIGRFLRATRLDELPQTINILKGDMSVVGPRPEQVHIVEQMRQQIPYYDERHIVKPGLTGWAQLHVYASSVEETKRKLQYDLYYIKHRSLLFDAEIILKTVYNIITLSGR